MIWKIGKISHVNHSSLFWEVYFTFHSYLIPLATGKLHIYVFGSPASYHNYLVYHLGGIFRLCRFSTVRISLNGILFYARTKLRSKVPKTDQFTLEHKCFKQEPCHMLLFVISTVQLWPIHILLLLSSNLLTTCSPNRFSAVLLAYTLCTNCGDRAPLKNADRNTPNIMKVLTNFSKQQFKDEQI